MAVSVSLPRIYRRAYLGLSLFANEGCSHFASQVIFLLGGRESSSAMMAIPVFLPGRYRSAQLGFVFRDIGCSRFLSRNIWLGSRRKSSSAMSAVPVFLPRRYRSGGSLVRVRRRWWLFPFPSREDIGLRVWVSLFADDGGFRFPPRRCRSGGFGC